MELLDGKKISEDIKNEIAAEVQKMKANGEKVPHLAAVIVGTDGASLTYVGSKVKACERVGFESTLIKMPNTTSETELLKKIKHRIVVKKCVPPAVTMPRTSTPMLVSWSGLTRPHPSSRFILQKHQPRQCLNLAVLGLLTSPYT